jgi:transposase
MVWTETTREKYRRDELRYASGTTDGEWAQIEPLLPARRALGRPRQWQLRPIVDAILYILATGCQWRALPRDFPPRSTVQGYFYRWRDDGTWRWVSAHLVTAARQAVGAQRRSLGRRHRQPERADRRKWRSARRRCRQAHQGAQAPHRYRHRGLPARRARA